MWKDLGLDTVGKNVDKGEAYFCPQEHQDDTKSEVTCYSSLLLSEVAEAPLMNEKTYIFQRKYVQATCVEFNLI